MSNVKVDDYEVTAMLDKLTEQNLGEISYKALLAAGSKFSHHVQANVDRSPIGGKQATTLYVDRWRGFFSVTILNRRNLLARIFERGTYKAEQQGGRFVKYRKNRFGRKVLLASPANRGNIRPYYFLAEAFSQHGHEIPDDYAQALNNLLFEKS